MAHKVADDFYNVASGFNDSATKFMMLFVLSVWDAMENSPEGAADVGKQKASKEKSRHSFKS